LIIGCGTLVLAAMLYGSTLDRSISYFPDSVVLIVVGGFGIGVISVILPLCAVADVGPREIGPVSAIQLMVYNLGGPLVLGGRPGGADVAHALPRRHDRTRQGDDAKAARRAGCRLRLLAAVGGRHRDHRVGAAALGIGFSARQIAAAQHNREAFEAGELEEDQP
jgi:hypothetical protein